MLFMIWIQTVCIGYQPTTKVNANNERVGLSFMMDIFANSANLDEMAQDLHCFLILLPVVFHPKCHVNLTEMGFHNHHYGKSCISSYSKK